MNDTICLSTLFRAGRPSSVLAPPLYSRRARGEQTRQGVSYVNEKAFYSKNFTLKCPVLAVVDSQRFAKENAGAILLLQGEPGLGRFLPLFLNERAAGEMAKAFGDVENRGAVQVENPGNLCKIIKKLGVKNVVVYLKKDRTRFYRAEDLIEELQSYAQN